MTMVLDSATCPPDRYYLVTTAASPGEEQPACRDSAIAGWPWNVAGLGFGDADITVICELVPAPDQIHELHRPMTADERESRWLSWWRDDDGYLCAECTTSDPVEWPCPTHLHQRGTDQMTQTEIVENEDLPENSDRVDENGRVWDSCTILALKLDSGEEVQIVLRYSDPAAAIQALKGVTQDERLFKLAVGIGAIDGYEFVEDDDD